jgi:hypothetical protein
VRRAQDLTRADDYSLQRGRLKKKETKEVGTDRSIHMWHTWLMQADTDTSQREIFISWALFIMIVLLIIALFTSYILQQKKVEAVHETVISIFGGW